MSEIHTIKRLATRLKKFEHISHSEALEVAAKQRGYANWQHAVRTEKLDPPKPDDVIFEHIMELYPWLNIHGVDIYRDGLMSASEKMARLKRGRAELRGSDAGSIRAASEWMARFPKVKTIVRHSHSNSYNLKHLLERDSGLYVTNGAFIVAALLAEFDMKTYENSPNPNFNVSLRAVKADELRVLAKSRK